MYKSYIYTTHVHIHYVVSRNKCLANIIDTEICVGVFLPFLLNLGEAFLINLIYQFKY